MVAPFDEDAGAGAAARRACRRAGPRGSPSAGAARSPAIAHRRGVLGLGLRRRRRRRALLHEHDQPVRLAGGWRPRRARRSGHAVRRRRDRRARGDGGRRRPAPVAALDRRGDRRDPRRAQGRGPGAGRVRVLARCPGDQRLAITHERIGRPAARACGTPGPASSPTSPARPDRARWSPSTGGRTAPRCCCSSLEAGRHVLYRFHLATGRRERLDDRARLDHGRRRPTRRRASGTAATTASTPRGCWRRLADAAARGDGPRPPRRGRPFEAWWFENPKGQRVHGFLVRPDGEGPHPVLLRVHGGPHSLDMDRWVPGPPGARRRGLPRRDGQLPRLRGLRAGVARRAHGERRLPRARGRARGPRRPRRARHRGPGAGRARRLVVGRLRDAAGRRPPPGPLGHADRRRPGRRLRRGVRGRGADAPGARPGAVRRVARRDARAVPRAQPDHLRGRGRRPAADPRGRERLALPDPPGLELRRPASDGGLEPRCTRTRPATPRSTSRSGSGRPRSCSTTWPDVPGTRLDGTRRDAPREAASTTTAPRRIASEPACAPQRHDPRSQRSRAAAVGAWPSRPGVAAAADEDVDIANFAFSTGDGDHRRRRHGHLVERARHRAHRDRGRPARRPDRRLGRRLGRVRGGGHRRLVCTVRPAMEGTVA